MPLDPRFPIVEGRCGLSDAWSIVLDRPYNRRAEEGAQVFWRPGVTMWITVWQNDPGKAAAQNTARPLGRVTESAIDIETFHAGGVRRIGYRLDEKGCQGVVYAYYGYVTGPVGHVQATIRCQSESDLAEARNVFQSICPTIP